jgi:tripartite-type tricarboxylate transporter receptor subunit TctC
MHSESSRRSFLRRAGAVAAAPLLAAAPFAARAQAWPAKPLRLVVPYAPGGGTDYFARTLATRLSQRLGQSIVVDNRPGAGTAIGAQDVARSAADGYNLLLGDSATFAVNPSLYEKLAYDPNRDFSPVSLTGRFSLLLVVNPKVLKVDTLAQLIETMKRKPGEIAYGTPGAGSPHHLAMALLAQRAGVQPSHIPYKGSGPALTDLLGGRVPLMFINLATAAQHVKSGALKVLAVSGDKRMAALPDVPTVAEAGLPGYEAWAWQGLAAPAGTPKAVIDRLSREYQELEREPAFRKQMLEDAGIETLHSSGPEMAAYMRKEQAKWAEVIRQANIKAD